MPTDVGLADCDQAWGIYIGVPFCRFKCTYCNFASDVFPSSSLDRYVAALAAEFQVSRPVVADTVYLGGGTPSMMTAGQFRLLFSVLRQVFEIRPESEVTLEAAPGSITADLARAWADCGVNRASLGVQSFVERELRAVGRPHRAETVARDMETLRTAGIGNIGFDLIAGLPHQTPAAWDESLEWLCRLKPEHASVYLLEIDEDSRLGAEVLADGVRYSAQSLPDEDAQAAMYCRAIERLSEAGYGQ